MTQLTMPSTQVWIQALNQEPAQGLHNGALPSVEAHHHVNGPDTGSNSGGRRTKKIPSSEIPGMPGFQIGITVLKKTRWCIFIFLLEFRPFVVQHLRICTKSSRALDLL